MAKLTAHVHVHDAEHGTVVFAAGTAREDLPDWARDSIGSHAFDHADEADDTSTESDETGDGPPNKNAKKDVWIAYAEKIGVELEPDATKGDIIAAVEAAEADNG